MIVARDFPVHSWNVEFPVDYRFAIAGETFMVGIPA